VQNEFDPIGDAPGSVSSDNRAKMSLARPRNRTGIFLFKMLKLFLSIFMSENRLRYCDLQNCIKSNFILVEQMKEVLGASAIALLFGIADSSAELRTSSTNILPVAERTNPYYSRRRWHRAIYKWRERYGPGGDRYIGRGPYPDRLTPGGVLTGPIRRSAKGGG
jgi:hypothetical protein